MTPRERHLRERKEEITAEQYRIRQRLHRHPEHESTYREILEDLKDEKKAICNELEYYKDYSGTKASKLFGKRLKDLTEDEERLYRRIMVYMHRNRKRKEQDK